MNSPTVSGGPQQTDPQQALRDIFVIARDDTGVHIYHDVQSMLIAIAAGSADAIEFFDVYGRELALVFNGAGVPVDLRMIGGEPDPAKVQGRLRWVIQNLASSVDRRLVRPIVPPGTTREQALARLPKLDGQSLGGYFAALQPVFGDGGASGNGEIGIFDDRDFWHNFWCH
jgi:hypothetical protein